MKIIAVTQARCGSSRLPNKILKTVGDQTLLQLHVARILQAKNITQLIIATTTAPADAVIADLAAQYGVAASRGSEQDVLDRFYQAVKDLQPDYVVRLTSDCPLIDPALIDKVIDFAVSNNLDYCSNTLDPTYPDGQDVEVVRFAALERAWHEAVLPSEREHVTPFVWKNSTYKGGTFFRSDNFSESYDYGHLRMTVDEPQDYEVICDLVAQAGVDKTWLEYAEILNNNAEIRLRNAALGRNEGYAKSIHND